MVEEYSNQTSSTSPETGSRRVVAGFGLIIVIGTFLLKLPFASTAPGSVSWIDAFFTATSAVTVTGLTLSSTATTYSLFGQIVILLLLQIGGIGFIALSVVLFRLAGRTVGMRDRFLLKETFGVDEASNILRLAGYVLGIVLAIEMIGALFLFVRWLGKLPWYEAAYYAIFHAISAFCNAGFDLFSGTDHEVLFGYGTDGLSLFVLGSLVLIGGLGIPVVDDLLRWRRNGRLTVHTRLTLSATLLLTVLGIVLFFVDQEITRGLLTGLPWGERFAVGSFTIVSARTAGITIIPLEQLSEANKLVLMIWMFIGGAPSSMAGGVSTSAVAVVGLAMLATVRGQHQALAYDRALSTETIFKAMAVMTVSTLLVASATMLMTLIQAGPLFDVGFEVVSAFSNTGYSLGLTGQLSDMAKVVLCLVMFWGRLGPLTLVVVLAQRHHPSAVTYPEEKVILG